MQKQIQKDSNIRKLFTKQELISNILKTIIKNENFSLILKLNAVLKLSNLSINLNKTRFVNRCVLTNRVLFWLPEKFDNFKIAFHFTNNDKFSFLTMLFKITWFNSCWLKDFLSFLSFWVCFFIQYKNNYHGDRNLNVRYSWHNSIDSFITLFSVSLYFISTKPLNGKSFRSGCPSKP